MGHWMKRALAFPDNLVWEKNPNFSVSSCQPLTSCIWKLIKLGGEDMYFLGPECRIKSWSTKVYLGEFLLKEGKCVS